MVNSAGGISTSYQYGPFGQTTMTGTSSTNPFQYIGRELDASGLYFMRARYYNLIAQRFISQDLIGLAGGQPNFYAYVFNSPMNWKDPLGLLAGAPMGAMAAFKATACPGGACPQSPPLGKAARGKGAQGSHIAINLRIVVGASGATPGIGTVLIDQLSNLAAAFRPSSALLRDGDLLGDPGSLNFGLGGHTSRVSVRAPDAPDDQ